MVKILIVDDSMLTIKMLKDIFSEYSLDLDVLSARDGLEALDKFKQEKPAMVFMDITMPQLDGMEALRKIREFDPQAKVVMASSLDEEKKKEEAVESGAIDYITKPFDKETLKEILEKHLGIDQPQ